jgi:xanthine dehydrogenase YagS FAD-binding subunit
MKSFTYYKPASAEQAVALLDAKWGKAELLAGGTDLLDLQKEYVAQPEKVVSLGAVKGIDKIEYEDKDPPVLYIGAGVKLADIAASVLLNKHCAALTTAAGDIGGPQIRNMGTLGGNLCQRNRCWYFRDEHVNCLLKGGEKCFALDGENRYHAVFTKGHKCVIVNPSTLAPALIALGATAEVLGPKGQRTVELTKFFKAPEGPGQREHVLESNEMVLWVRIPTKAGQKSASYEVRHKQSYDWPLVQGAAALTLDGGKAKDVRIVLGHVAPTPLVAEAAMKAVEGQAITEETAGKAGEAATDGAKALSQNAYKLRLIAVAVKRALLTAAGAKKYWEVA